MAVDPLRQFLEADFPADNQEPIDPQGVSNAPRAALPLPGVFDAQVKASTAGFEADLEYFKALGNTLIGDDEAAVENIRQARYDEVRAANASEGIQPFEEFLDAPTWEGFATQLTKAPAQLLPYALTSIAGGVIGGVTAVAGKAAFSTVTKKAAEKIVKDALRKTANKTATPDEQKLAQAAYTTFKRGAITGAFGSEFVPLAGSNLSEALDSGQELDRGQALRAAGVAVPQAALGVGGDVAFLKLLGDVAARRTVKADSIYGQLAADISRSAGKGGVIQTASEMAQEEIAIQNRFDLDETYTQEDANLRRLETAFTSLIGGTALGGTTGAAGSVVGNRNEIAQAVGESLSQPVKGATEQVATIFDKARRYMDDAQTQRTEEAIAEETVGDVPEGQTQPEAAADINAQLSAMVNPTSKKQAVWVSGDEAQYSARPNKSTEITVDGQLAFAAFIPGRGTIVSTSRKIVDEVVASGASDEAVGAALGYSNVKPQSFGSGESLLVARALDADGNVVSEELASEDTIDAAMEAARGLMPEGGSVQRVDAEQALEERAKRFNGERGPTVEPVDDDPDSFDAPDQTETPTFGSEFEELSALKSELAMTEQEGERTIVETYAPKTDPARTFDNTEQARADYVAAFGETDFNSPEFAGVSESTLNRAVQESRNNPNSIVEITKNQDGQFEVVRTDFDKLYRFQAGGKELRLTLPEFISRAITKAKQGKFSRQSGVVLIAPDGKTHRINLADLTFSGQRLVENREGKPFVGAEPIQSAQQGLSEVLGDLLLEGYQVEVLGQPINEVLSGRVDERLNVPAARIAGQTVGLADLFNGVKDPGKQRFLTEDQKAENKRQLRQTYNDPALRQIVPYQMPRETRSEEVVPGDPDYVEGQRTFRQVPIEQAAEGRTETEVFAGDPRDDIDPDRRTGSAPSTGTGETAADPVSVPPPREDPQGFDDPLVRSLINDALDAVKLVNPPRIFNLERLTQLSDAQLSRLFSEVELVAVQRMIQRQLDNLEIGGSYDGKVNIAVINPTGNALSDAMTAAHEIGHAVYQQEQQAALENDALRPRLVESYKRHPKHDRYVELYGFEKGFEEWYADQLSRWATKRYANKAAKNMVDKHFKELVEKLKKMWRAMKQGFRARKGPKSPEFEQYIEGVVASKKQSAFVNEVVRGQVKYQYGGRPAPTQITGQVQEDAGPAPSEPPLTFTEKAMPHAVKEAVVKEGGEALARHWERSISRASRPLMKFVATADGVLRMHAGNRVADMFYRRSQEDGSGGNLGMLRASALKVAEFQNTFEDTVGSLDDPEVKDALREAASSDATETLSPKAQQVRQFLQDVYTDYIQPSNTDIGFQKDYFPVLLNMLEIENRTEEFKNLILAEQQGISPARAEAAIYRLRQYSQAMRDDKPVDYDPTNPAAGVEQDIMLTRGIDRKTLQDAGFLQEPEEALVSYLRHVAKRVEFNKATNNGLALKEELSKLSEEDRAATLEVLNAYMGYQSSPISPLWRKLNSYGQFLQFVTILPFATIASLTDLAGPVINSKEFSLHTFGMAMKQIKDGLRDPEERRQFARDVGVVTNETVANGWVTQAEQDYMDPKVRKLSDAYFRVIMLDQFTRFSREFAAGMGASFITHHARNEFDNPRSERYLRELGLTAEDVNKWNKEGRKFSTPEGKKVKQAIQRFTESSILRPNAAERPIWASDPRWALVWQLKSYFYAYSKVIGGGIVREAQSRMAENPGELNAAQISATLSVFALAAVATMPLAMLGMELREYAKTGLAWALPGVEPKARYFRTDRMDWDEYLFETIDRSGFLGPLSLGVMAHQQYEWDGPIGGATSILGPTAETITEALENGWRVDRTLKDRLLPVYNVL